MAFSKGVMKGRKEEKCPEEKTAANEGCGGDLKIAHTVGNLGSLRSWVFQSTHIIEV